MKNKHFTENGWKDYLFQKQNDRETLKKINLLIADICENGTTGIGKPEPPDRQDGRLLEPAGSMIKTGWYIAWTMTISTFFPVVFTMIDFTSYFRYRRNTFR